MMKRQTNDDTSARAAARGAGGLSRARKQIDRIDKQPAALPRQQPILLGDVHVTLHGAISAHPGVSDRCRPCPRLD
jgi:hypothetical protein